MTCLTWRVRLSLTRCESVEPVDDTDVMRLQNEVSKCGSYAIGTQSTGLQARALCLLLG